MHNELDPDEYETEIVTERCNFHKKHPEKRYAGCTCSGSISKKKRNPMEVEKAKADRLAMWEESINRRAKLFQEG